MSRRGCTRYLTSISLACAFIFAFLNVAFIIFRHNHFNDLSESDLFEFYESHHLKKLVKIFVLPNIPEDDAMGELKHVIFDGIERSKWLERTNTSSDSDAVWVVDVTRAGNTRDESYCDELLEIISPERAKRQSGWRLILLDFSDNGDNVRKVFSLSDSSDESVISYSENCTSVLATLVGNENITISTRNHVKDRSFTCFYRSPDCYGCKYYDNLTNCFDETEPFKNHVGEKIDYTRLNISNYVSNGTVNKLFYPVRSDLVASINKQLLLRNMSNVNPVDVDRQVDVLHFWDAEVSDPFAQLRSRVSEAIVSLNSSDITAIAKQFGHRYSAGRNKVADKYSYNLLSSKIVVVCQRDIWEGHYRLMEALISGALVFTDPMIYLPSGFKDGVNLVVYNSIVDLKEKVKYYLQDDKKRRNIARRGRDLALSKHRSWHYMEDYILHFGINLSSPKILNSGLPEEMR